MARSRTAKRGPAHGKLAGHGEWANGSGQRGERFVQATSEPGAGIWQSDELTLVPDSDYRLEGWVRSAQPVWTSIWSMQMAATCN